MKPSTYGWRWIAGGLMILLIANGCAGGQTGKNSGRTLKTSPPVRNADGSYNVGATTYWNMAAPTGSAVINPDNYAYQRIAPDGSIQEDGYYLTVNASDLTQRDYTRVRPLPPWPANPDAPSVPGEYMVFQWETQITHPGGSPNAKSVKAGVTIRITHPGG